MENFSQFTPSPVLASYYLDSCIFFAQHMDKKIITDIKMDIKKFFYKEIGYYLGLSIETYRAIVRDAQDYLNEKQYVRQICEQCLIGLQVCTEEEKFFMQTNLYLRATRPILDQETESIGWHRETFYGSNMEQSFNVWTPILGVDESNTLRFIPKSQLIPESDIILQQVCDKTTVKGSSGNKIGFLYSPKNIIDGVDLKNSTPLIVPEYNSALFSGLLIHGSAVNHSENIRFSVDFRILPFSAYKPDKCKSFHFASGKPYFELY